MLFEYIDESMLGAYEKYYFEKICRIPTGSRRSFSTPLSQIECLHFACVQDTVERLIETEHGKLSTFQWRNFIFAPIDRGVREQDIFMQVFEELRSTLPSLFIRSYVYVVFVKIYGSGALTLADFENEPTTKDFVTYYWNTKYDIGKISPSKLATIGRVSNTKPTEAGEGSGEQLTKRAEAQRVFIVADPRAELQRIQDANSDVIDAVKAFTGNLGLVKQTADMLDDIESDLKEPGARVLLEGPARSGKTIIAMSLLASDSSAQMLLMNWYFYEALKDAFRVWAKMDEKEIARLFESSERLQKEMAVHESDLAVLRASELNPQFIDALIKMWRNPPDPTALRRWKKCSVTDSEQEWLITRCQGMNPGDLVHVYRRDKGIIQLHIIEEVVEGGMARPKQLFGVNSMYNNRPFGGEVGEATTGPPEPDKILKHLEDLRCLVHNNGLAATIARKLKGIADTLETSEQRFFHHDRHYQDGLWFDKSNPNTKFISDGATLVCDEAQRLGVYGRVDEVKWVRRRHGKTFLCGDDYQRLNRRGDRGITPVIDGMGFGVRHLPDSIGIPPEMGQLVNAMLGEAEVPKASQAFTIKLMFKDDLGLVKEFARDPHGKKHYAMPLSEGFYRKGYYPCIMRSRIRTDRCTDECDSLPYGICRHRYILPLSPLSDPSWMPKRDDLSRNYKFFCAEAIMPEFALSAYELISREVESIYLKIPWQITLKTLQAPMDGDSTDSWIKRHLYVLMTRATANLVINIEDKQLYDRFRLICEEAGI